MTERNVDDLIREWTDIGEEHLPDRYLQAALAEIETTPQRGTVAASLKGLIMRFQSTAPYLAVAAVAVAAVVLYVSFARSPVGGPDASATPTVATPESSGTISPSPAPELLVPSATFEITTPLGSAPSRKWGWSDVSEEPPQGIGDPRLVEGLRGFGFGGDFGGASIFLDPNADYVGTVRTSPKSLVVAFDFSSSTPEQRIGFFVSTSGECSVTFDEFTPTVATGSLECVDVPGTYQPEESPETLIEGVAQLSGTFAFDPSTEPAAGPTPSEAAASFELNTPAGSTPSSGWTFEAVGDRLDAGVHGYQFLNGSHNTGNGYRVVIYLDPAADYAGEWDTSRGDLIVVVDYTIASAGGKAASGRFESASGECQITFDQFTATAATGRLDCSDIPGTYASPGETAQEGVVQLSGTFAFDPRAEPAN